MHSNKQIKKLISDLDARKWITKRTALKELDVILDPRTVEPLIERLNDPDTRVVCRVITILGKIGDLRAFDPLVKMLDHEKYIVRDSVIEALVNIGDPRGIEPVIERLNDPDKDQVRWGVAVALEDFGDVRAIKPLIEQLNEENPDLRKRYVLALVAVLEREENIDLFEIRKQLDEFVEGQNAAEEKEHARKGVQEVVTMLTDMIAKSKLRLQGRVSGNKVRAPAGRTGKLVRVRRLING